MSVTGEGVGRVGDRAALRSSRETSGRTFAAELARTRAALRSPGAPLRLRDALPSRDGAASGSSGAGAAALSVALLPSAALALRRRGHDEGQREVDQRRVEAEPGQGQANPVSSPAAAPGLALADRAGGAAAPQPRPSGTLFAAAGLERLSLSAEMGGTPALLLAFGPELRVRLAQAGAAPGSGVDLRLSAPPPARAAALAELDGLTAALREQGIGLASAALSPATRRAHRA